MVFIYINLNEIRLIYQKIRQFHTFSCLKKTPLYVGLLTTYFGRSQGPLADFSASPLVACVGETISFINNSSVNGGSPIQEFVWDFGNGKISSEESVIHSYELPGLRWSK